MFNKLHIPLAALLISLFSVVSIWGSGDYVQPTSNYSTFGGTSPIPKKAQKDQRRMDKKSRKSKPSNARIVAFNGNYSLKASTSSIRGL